MCCVWRLNNSGNNVWQLKGRHQRVGLWAFSEKMTFRGRQPKRTASAQLCFLIYIQGLHTHILIHFSIHEFCYTYLHIFLAGCILLFKKFCANNTFKGYYRPMTFIQHPTFFIEDSSLAWICASIFHVFFYFRLLLSVGANINTVDDFGQGKILLNQMKTYLSLISNQGFMKHMNIVHMYSLHSIFIFLKKAIKQSIS